MKSYRKDSAGPKVILSQIADRASFKWTEAEPWLEGLLIQQLSEHRKAKNKVLWQAEIERQGKNFSLTGEYRVEIDPVCGRCGKHFSKELSGNFSLLLIPAPQEFTVASAEATPNKRRKGRKGPKDESDEFEEAEWGASDTNFVEDDVGASFFSRDEIDLSRYFMEDILLTLPMTFLCRENCPGLCPSCGRDLSLGSCGCHKEQSDDRWDALKRLKLN